MLLILLLLLLFSRSIISRKSVVVIEEASDFVDDEKISDCTDLPKIDLRNGVDSSTFRLSSFLSLQPLSLSLPSTDTGTVIISVISFEDEREDDDGEGGDNEHGIVGHGFAFQ